MVEADRFIDGPAEAGCVEVLEEDAVAAVLLGVERIDGVVNAAGVVGESERAEFRTDHLGQATRLEPRRHDHEVGRGVAKMGERLREVRHRHPPVKMVPVHECAQRVLVTPVCDDGDLQSQRRVVARDLLEDLGEELMLERRLLVETQRRQSVRLVRLVTPNGEEEGK